MSRDRISKAPRPAPYLNPRSDHSQEPKPELHPLSFEGPHWGPWQVIAWIISRQEKLVEQLASDGRRPKKKWDKIDWSQEARKAKASGAENVALDYDAALAALAYACEIGLVSASGCHWYRDEGEGRRRKIDPALWGASAALSDSLLEPRRGTTPKWTQVWFDRQGVLNRWPATPQVATAKVSKRGPRPNTVDRYSAGDASLFPEIKRLLDEGSESSVSAAARRLARDGNIAGSGTAESRASRLAKRYRASRNAEN